jgi:hypothetical protein
VHHAAAAGVRELTVGVDTDSHLPLQAKEDLRFATGGDSSPLPSQP